MGMVERQEVDTYMPLEVSGLHSLPTAFSALSTDVHKKQVISLAGSSDTQLVKVCTVNHSRKIRF